MKSCKLISHTVDGWNLAFGSHFSRVWCVRGEIMWPADEESHGNPARSCLFHVFPQMALAIGVLTSSIGVRVRRFSCVFFLRVSDGYRLVFPHIFLLFEVPSIRITYPNHGSNHDSLDDWMCPGQHLGGAWRLGRVTFEAMGWPWKHWTSKSHCILPRYPCRILMDSVHQQ